MGVLGSLGGAERGETGKGDREFVWLCLFVWFLSLPCLVLRRKPEDIEDLLPCSFISNPLMISEKESCDFRRML